MAKLTSTTSPIAYAARPETGAVPPLFGLILKAARESQSTTAFFGHAIRAIAESTNSPYAAIAVQQGAESFQEEHHTGPTDPAFWKERVQRFLTESLAERRTRALILSARAAELRLGLISVPLHTPQGNNCGAVALVAPISEADAREKVAYLESVAALISHCAGLVGMSGSASSTAAAPSQTLARAAAYESVEELAFALTNNLRNRLSLQIAALGLVCGTGIRILSISGLADVKPRSPGVGVMRAAMEECLDAGRVLIAPAPPDDGEQPVLRLQQQWLKQSQSGSVASIPLSVNGQTIAILSVAKSGDEHFTAADVQSIRTTVEPFAPAIQLVQRASRSVSRHAREAVHGHLMRLLGKGHLKLKLGAIAFALSLAWLLFGTLPYEVAATGTLVPAEMRHISAPYEGILRQAAVVAGDRVQAGQLLCTLDTRELQLQKNELQAQRAVNEQELQKSLADNEPVGVKIAESNRALLDAKLASLQRRIDAAEIRSPIDGVVVSGDLRASLGATFKQGDPFFQIAPLANWSLEVAVPEWAVADVAIGQQGRFVAEARSEAVRAFRIERIEPNAVVRKGANVFVAEAVTEIDPAWMRPGMEGTARVSIGTRRSWWVLLHRAIDTLRVNFWL